MIEIDLTLIEGVMVMIEIFHSKSHKMICSYEINILEALSEQY